jgi:hypothetical protein
MPEGLVLARYNTVIPNRSDLPNKMQFRGRRISIFLVPTSLKTTLTEAKCRTREARVNNVTAFLSPLRLMQNTKIN